MAIIFKDPRIDSLRKIYGYVTPEDGFTIEGWFLRNNEPTTQHACLVWQRTQGDGLWTTNTGRHFFFGFSPTAGSGFFLNVIKEGGTMILDYTDASPDGYHNDDGWHHFALRLDKLTQKAWSIFLDGQLLTTQTASDVPNWQPGQLVFGGEFAPNKGVRGQFAYDNKLAYLAVFNHELTDNRIQEHYTAGSSGTVYYGDDEVTRLTRIFDWANVPIESRILQAPRTVLQGIKVADSNAFQAAQKTAADAGGYIYADGQTAIQYHNRQHRYNRWVALTLGESSGAAPEIGMTFSTQSKTVFNDIRGERPFGTKVRIENEVSQDINERKVHSFEISVTDHDELKNAVTWILSRYGIDRVRVSGVKFSCSTSLLLKELAYSRVDIGDVLILTDLIDPAPTDEMQFVIEGLDVSADFLAKKWDVEVALSPHELNRVFQVGVSKLGGGDLVAY